MPAKPENFFGRANRTFFWEQLRLSHLLLCAAVAGLHLLLLASGRLDRFENIALDYFDGRLFSDDPLDARLRRLIALCARQTDNPLPALHKPPEKFST